MDNLADLIEESIELELNAAGLYALFHFAFPDDAAFWWQLHQEERNHASLLRSIKDTFLPISVYPDALVLPSLEQLKKSNEKLRHMLEKFRTKPPSREDSFHIAMEVETSAGEIHFQRFAEKMHENKIDQIFSQLVKDDKDHLQRIQQYMIDRNIKMNEISS